VRLEQFCLDSRRVSSPHAARPTRHVDWRWLSEADNQRDRDETAIKAIAELQASPGKQAEMKNLLESIAATLGPGKPGFLGSKCKVLASVLWALFKLFQ